MDRPGDKIVGAIGKSGRERSIDLKGVALGRAEFDRVADLGESDEAVE